MQIVLPCVFMHNKYEDVILSYGTVLWCVAVNVFAIVYRVISITYLCHVQLSVSMKRVVSILK
jgi:hypothetical protein